MGALERLSLVGITKLVAIHRGFSSTQKRVLRNIPYWRIPLELKRQIPEIPIICDPSHICGNRDKLSFIAQEAMDLLFDGLMIEVHENPDHALSDAQQQITSDEFIQLVDKLELKKEVSHNPDFLEHIDLLRKEIDELDNELLEILEKRMHASEKIALIKKKERVSPFQPDRWNKLLKNRIRNAKIKSLNEDFIFQIYQLIHEESIRHQELIIAENSERPKKCVKSIG